jgi:hypothetical protein
MKWFKYGLGLSALTVACLVQVSSVQALEITIEGNGAGSSSEVQATQTTETSITQTNNTEVKNDVEVQANTGGNEVSGNSGQATVETGSIDTNTSINNQVNETKIQDKCCSEPKDTTINISGNGVDSTNTVNAGTTNTTSVSITQTATITNEIKGNLDTGHNTVTNNQGSVSIRTGDITGEVTITNGVNTADIDVASTHDSDSQIKIKDNGEGSVNTISNEQNNLVVIQKNEVANIDNKLAFDLSTGNNKVDDNFGAVSIITGDVFLSANVINGPINDNHITITPCDENPINPPPVNPPPVNPPPVIPPPVTPPTVNPNNNSSSSNSNSDDDSHGIGGIGDVLGLMLPDTGTMDMLMMLVANISLFLLGWYLRLRSGRAPATN